MISFNESSLVFSSSFSNLLDLAAALTKWKTAGKVLKREHPLPISDQKENTCDGSGWGMFRKEFKARPTTNETKHSS